MASFDIAFKITGGHEGGFANDLNDRGGMTINGIARTMWPEWVGWAKIDKIIKAVGINPNRIDIEAKKDAEFQSMVKNFYKTNFWDAKNLGAIISQPIANEVYDTGVNMHTTTAAKFLQEALNLCNRNGFNYPDMVIDGAIGSRTIDTLNRLANEKMVLATLNCLQAEKYLDIMRSSKSQEKFWPGWMKRVLISW